MATKSYGSITIVDITDIGEFSVQPTANLPLTVIYNPDQGNFTPDWGSSNLQLVPVVYYSGKQVVLGSTGLTITWSKRIGISSSESSIGDGETNTNGNLNITKNQFTQDSSMLTYIVTAQYIEPTSGQTLTAQGQITFSLIKQASSIRSCRITGENVFKYDGTGKAIGATSIVLTAHLDNVSVLEWQYQNADGDWVKYPDSTASINLTVKNTDDVFINDSATIKLTTTDNSDYTTDDANIYDVHVITKLRDGAAGENTVSAVLTNDDQMIPFTTAGVGDFTEAKSQIVIYEGGKDVTSEYTITQTSNGCTSTSSSTTVENDTVKVTAMSGTTANVVFTASKDGVNPLTKTFSLVRVTSGADGKTPTIYSIEASSLAMNRNTDNVYTPTSVTFMAYSLTVDADGNQVKRAYSGRFAVYEDMEITALNSTDANITNRKYYSQSDESSYTYTPSTSATSILCLLYSAGGTPNGAATNRLDYQAVVVTKDGEAGATGATGAQGDAGINVVMGNFADVIPCTHDNKTQAAITIEIPFAAYQGTNKISATAPAAADIKLFGITPSVTNATSTADGKITWEIPAGTDVTSQSGTLALAFTVTGIKTSQGTIWDNATYDNGTLKLPTTQNTETTQTTTGVTQQIVHDYRWTRSTAAQNGENAVLLTVGTPSGGNIISNNIGTITLQAMLYDGTDDVSTSADVTWQWKKWNGSSYTAIAGATSRQKVVQPSEIDGYASFKVQATYKNATYSAFESCYDKTDPIQVSVFSSIGAQIVNGNGYGALYVKVTQNGQEIDPILSEVFSDTAPQNPSNGDYYYKIDKTNKSLALYEYDGSAWSATTENYKGTYTWSYRDKDGNSYSVEGLSTSGKVIYIDGTLIDSKIIADVEVDI